jgi:uncharacterized protein (TIGR02145 family)
MKTIFKATVLFLGIYIISGCKPDELLKVTKLQTGEISNITYNSATANGEFVDLSGNVSEYGHCWNTSGNPTNSNSKYPVSGTAKKGPFSSDLTGLTGETKYYVRAYAIDNGETFYGHEVNFTTLEGPYIKLIAPADTSHLAGGDTYTIKWEDNVPENVRIQLFNGNNWAKDITSTGGTSNNGYLQWLVPSDLNDGLYYNIRIASTENNQLIAISDSFEIAMLPVDFHGFTYRIIKIGERWWMKENLRSTRYSNGDMINKVIDNTKWKDLQYYDKAYCHYNNDSILYSQPYGVLYTWAAAMNGATNERAHGVCPIGWHVPSDTEWKEMEDSLGNMSETELNSIGWRGSNEGNKLKEAGTAHWTTPNSGATNESGFTALPSGQRGCDDGVFYDLQNYAHFWTSSFFDTYYAWYRRLYYNYSTINRNNYKKNHGRAIRCVKDKN